MSSTDLDRDPELAAYLALDDRPGPAARISRERALAMVETALVELPAPVAAPRRTAGVKTRWLVTAGAVFGVVSGVAAARWYFSEPQPAPRAPAAVGGARPPRETQPSPTPPSEVVIPAALEQAATPAPSDADDEVAERTNAGERRGAVEDLLQKANRLRTQGRFREAARTYDLVSERYPKTLSSYVAQVAAGSLELEHLSHPARARRLFERALREHPEGALDLEARQGVATALRDLGDSKAEIGALRRLIDLHPNSPAARRAAARLRELGAS